MPPHPDMQKIKDEMVKKHGDKKGTEIFYKWINSHGLDDTKSLHKQKEKLKGDADDQEFERLIEEAIDKDPSIGPDLTLQPKGRAAAIEIPAFTNPYSATALATMPDLGIWAIALEEGTNVNGWRVMTPEFDRVAAAYAEGRQLRLNHEGKLTEKIIGKSDQGFNVLGKDIESTTGVPFASYGLQASDINPNGHYVVAHFVATPEDPQVRTNILKGYVTAGSIGLQGNGYCDVCHAPVDLTSEGFERTCDDDGSIIDMVNVDVKEWSIVPEPAYAHTFFYPTLTAALDSMMAAKHKAMEEPTPSPVGEDIKNTKKNVSADPPTPDATLPPNTSSLNPLSTQVILGSTMTDTTDKKDADAEAKFTKMEAAITGMAEAVAKLAESEAKRAEADAKKADAEAESCKAKATADAKKADADAEAGKAKGEASDKGGVVVAAVPTTGFNLGPIFYPKLYANAAAKSVIDEARRVRGMK